MLNLLARRPKTLPRLSFFEKYELLESGGMDEAMLEARLDGGGMPSTLGAGSLLGEGSSTGDVGRETEFLSGSL